MTPNGHTGYGLVPNAGTQGLGTSQLHYTAAYPGAAKSEGHSMVIGWGLTDTFELSGRLTTQSVNCNFYFGPSLCPPGTSRDLSGSFKWAPRISALDAHGVRVAIGGVDIGGAANLSRSVYGVATATRRYADLSIGGAKGSGVFSPLRGGFADLTFKPFQPVRIGVQAVDRNAWAHASYTSRLPYLASVQVTAGVVRRIHPSPTSSAPSSISTPDQWWNITLESPLATGATSRRAVSTSPKTRRLPEVALEALSGQLRRAGFYRHRIEQSPQSVLHVTVENTAYRWNLVDAAGAAVAAIASADRRDGARFKLRVQHSGLDQLILQGNTNCVRNWLETAEPCVDMELVSALTSSLSTESTAGDGEAPVVDQSESWSWPRPEIAIGPLINSTIGTEFGVLDFDLAYTVNVLAPLWKGATLDISYLRPTGLRTDDFETGYFSNNQFQAVENRRMLHQVISRPAWNTQMRISAGRSYISWEGAQVEVQSQTRSGQDRATLVWGKFENPTFFRSNRREYAYLNYRHAWDPQHHQTTTVILGEFWGGDRGYQLTHRFWFGDTNVAVFFRESTFGPGTPRASFGGIAISLPLTLRRLDGFRALGVRGNNQFSYAVETRLRNPSNDVGGGYGIVPAMGEPLTQSLNRDRNGTEYLNSQLWRLRRAAIELND